MTDRTTFLSWAIVGFGVLLPFFHFAGGRGLWVDEAMVALNLRILDWRELSGPLEFEQVAPLGWLYLQKAQLLLTGNEEYGLRFASFAAWTGSLVLFRFVCLRTFVPVAALGALTLFALSIGLQRYAVEVKPYAFDVLFATASLACAAQLIAPARRASVAAWIAFGLTGVGAALFSFGGVFAFAASGLAVMIYQARSKDWRMLLVAAGCCALAAALFLLLYLGVYRGQVAGTTLIAGNSAEFFEASYYAPLLPSFSTVRWYLDWGLHTIEFVFSSRSSSLASALVVLGAFLLSWRRPVLAVAAVGPILLGLLASSAHAYPMFERLTLFIFPGLILGVAALFERLLPAGNPSPWPVAVLTAGVALGSVHAVAGQSSHWPPFARHELRPLLEQLHTDIKPGDRLYVNRLGNPVYLAYRDRAGLGGLRWMEGRTASKRWSCYLGEVRGIAAGERIWLVIADDDGPDAPYEIDLALAALGISASPTLVRTSASAFLYRLDVTAVDEDRPVAPSLECRSTAEMAPMHSSDRLRTRLEATNIVRRGARDD